METTPLNTRQHCDQAVTFGPSPAGYRAFTHDTTGQIECAPESDETATPNGFDPCPIIGAGDQR